MHVFSFNIIHVFTLVSFSTAVKNVCGKKSQGGKEKKHA
jgi:hypothetical protein